MEIPIKKMLQNQRVIYWASPAMLFLFAAVVFFLIRSGSLGEPDYSMAELFQMIILLLVPISLGAAYFVFRFAVAKIERKLPLREKLGKHFSLVIIRSALLEVPGLFCCVAAFLTREMLFLLAVPMILFVFALLRPTAATLTEELNLAADERKQLEG